MARTCELCGKGYLKGNLVCFSNKKSIKRSYPNLRKIRLSVGGSNARIMVCTGCLSLARKNSSEPSEKQAQVTVAK